MVKMEHAFGCAICGKLKKIEVTISDADSWAIERGQITLKDALRPGTFEREVFISGMCFDCQEKTFNRPAPGHEDAWGKRMGECPCCGCSLYKKDIDVDKCPSCSCKISEEME